MRDSYINAALDRLTELVDNGLALPTAHESVVANFELSAYESHILLSRYDTMLHNLDKVIMPRARAQALAPSHRPSHRI